MDFWTPLRFMYSAGALALHPPLKGPVAPVARQLPSAPHAKPARWARCASARRTLGARFFQNGHFGRISSTLYFTVLQNLGGHASTRCVSHEPCFRQAHCFVQGRLRFLPVPPNPTCARSHIWGFPTFRCRGCSSYTCEYGATLYIYELSQRTREGCMWLFK